MGVPQGSVLEPLLYLTYTIPIPEVIKKCKLNYHIYTDDTQRYVAFKNDDIVSITDRITDRIADRVSDIYLWMAQNELSKA